MFNLDLKKIGAIAAGAVVLIAGIFFVLNSGNQDGFVVPDQGIIGAEDVIEPGDGVDLSLSKISIPVPNLVSVKYLWKVYDNGKDKRVRVSEDGTNIWFAAGMAQRKVDVFVVCTYLYETKNFLRQTSKFDASSSLLKATVTIGKPGPDPGPDPDLPPGKYNLGKTTFNLVNSHVANDLDRVKAAKALANSFSNIVKDIDDNKLSSPVEILKRSFEENNKELANVNVDPSKWDSFFTELQKVLVQLYKEKKIVTSKDYSIAFKEIKDGLNKVK
jgi:hypothetical protein